jgi:cysteine desulfurase / selenocysteine lyase
MNGVAIAGLLAAVRWLKNRGVEATGAHERALAGRLRDGLGELKGVRLCGPVIPESGIISLCLDTMDCAQTALRLEDEHGILCRTGISEPFPAEPSGFPRALAAIRSLLSGAGR